MFISAKKSIVESDSEIGEKIVKDRLLEQRLSTIVQLLFDRCSMEMIDRQNSF